MRPSYLVTYWAEVRPEQFVFGSYAQNLPEDLRRRLGENLNLVMLRQVVPGTPAADVLALEPHGVFLSNGPGDPSAVKGGIDAVADLVGKLPIFGICLGHQILSIVLGAKTSKMPFGHHGANHPVVDLDTKRVLITSQNHGFAVDEESLPDNVRATHRSLFDGSLQGIERLDRAAFSFQGHPEASPGPHDLLPLFERFLTQMRAYRQ